MDSKTEGKTFQIFSEGWKTEHFATPNTTCENFANQLCLVKTLRNLKEVANSVRNSKTHFATLPIPTVSMRNTNGQGEIKRSLKQAYLKTSKASIHFASPICSLRNPAPPCESAFSPVDIPWPPIWRSDLHFSPHFGYGTHQRRPYRPLVSREAKPRTSAPQDSSQALQSPTGPSSEGKVPSSPPQHRYVTQRPLIHSQLVYLEFGPQTRVINKIYNLYHHALG